MVAAGQPAVVLDGGPARRVRLHVVDLAVAGGTVAELVVALPVAHLDGPAGGAGEDAPAHTDVLHPVGPVEHHPLHPRLTEPGQEAPGGDDGAVGQLADAPGEGLVAHEHTEQRLGEARPGRHGAGPARHLHHRVGPALGTGAGQVRRADPLARPGPGLGPVGLEQNRFDALERAVEHGPADGVEDPVEDPGAGEALGQVQAAGIDQRTSAVLGADGIGLL